MAQTFFRRLRHPVQRICILLLLSSTTILTHQPHVRAQMRNDEGIASTTTFTQHNNHARVLPPCTSLSVGSGVWREEFPNGGMNLLGMRKWFYPHKCRLKAFSPSEARVCVGGQVLMFEGASFTRNLFTAMVGFVVEDFLWDIVEGAPSLCSDTPEGRYTHNHECHAFSGGFRLNMTHTCSFHGPNTNWSYTHPDLTCKRHKSGVEFAGGTHVGYAIGQVFQRSEKYNGLLAAVVTKNLQSPADVVVAGFHHGFTTAPREAFHRKVVRGITSATMHSMLLGKGNTTRTMIVHSLHARDGSVVPPEYWRLQNNTAVLNFNENLLDAIETARKDLPKHINIEYWEQYEISSAEGNSNYKSEKGSDGTHLALEVQIMKMQILLNFLCPSAEA